MTQTGIADFVGQLREADPWRYTSVLFLAKEHREDVACLYCFAAELARIPQIASEPGLGEIRLQWWREALEGERGGEAAANPLSAGLLSAIERHNLNRDTLARIAEARAFDLYHDPMGDKETLEAWLGETQSVLFHEAAVICGAERRQQLGDAAGHAGVAYGTALLLRRLAETRGRAQIYLPSDILERAGLMQEEFLGELQSGHDLAIELACDFAEEHRRKAVKAVSNLEAGLKPVFLPLALIPPTVKAARKMRGQAMVKPVELSPLARQIAYWKAALAGL